ncbi:hypothetical protein SELMODRAFT_425362 [Selaginella moellendorffii]|uniref:Glutathione synthase substrate-binding domain-containing protein n=1 Tax=Selaginella moellendorffii TaxID=88036 RepID=D8SSV3_SELML|nr:hypothetical protein SELMODRAFT_425362 [Selaginella moellendorffii]
MECIPLPWQFKFQKMLSRTAKPAATPFHDFESVTVPLSSNGTLSVDGHLVAVAYYRSGYAPDDPSELGWHARLLLERYKMSMDLIPLSWNQESATRACQAECIRKGLNEESYEIINKQPELFVLKPQCEGGGNTIYGSAVKAKQHGGAGLSAYILIFPPTYMSYLIFFAGMAKEKSPTRIVATC